MIGHVFTMLLAAGWSTTDRSVVAMGLGGAGAAHGADPGAGAYNAAASAFHPGFAASAGLMLAVPRLQASGDVEGATSGVATPPALHLRWVGEQFSASASLTVPFGSSVEWPADWGGRFDLREARVRALRASATFGARFGDLAIAAGPFVDFGSLRLVRALDFVAAEGSTAIDTRAIGLGAQVSAFYRISSALDVGLAWQSRSRLALTGYADFDVPPELRGRAIDGPVAIDVTLPDRITLGALYRVNEDLELLADLELVLWSTIDRLDIDFEDAAMSDLSQARDWRPTVTPRLGASWRALSFLTARGGILIDPSPVPAETVGAASPDSLRVGLSLGAGVTILPSVSLELAYQSLVLTGADAESDNYGRARYAGTAHLVGAGLTVALDQQP
jgi:long-chain fatty acid transport protein